MIRKHCRVYRDTIRKAYREQIDLEAEKVSEYFEALEDDGEAWTIGPRLRIPMLLAIRVDTSERHGFAWLV